MRLKTWLALFLVAGCVDHPHGNPQITDPDSVGTPLPAAILEHSKGDGDLQPGIIGRPLRQRLLVRVSRQGDAVANMLVHWVTNAPGAIVNPAEGSAMPRGS